MDSRFLKVVFLSVFLGMISSCTPAFVFTHFPDLAEDSLKRKLKKAENKAHIPSASAKELIHVCSLKVMVAYGFILENADRQIEADYTVGLEIYTQAHHEFIQAVNYGEQAIIKKYPDYFKWLSGKPETDPGFQKNDIPYLYWSAAALGGAIKSSRGNPDWVIRLPEVGKYLEKAIELDSSWNNGSLYSAMISYSVSRTDISNGLIQARKYFEKALQVSDGMNPGAIVSFAESVSVKNQDKKEFEELLKKVLTMKQNNQLGQVLAKRRAEWLLSRTEDLFF